MLLTPECLVLGGGVAGLWTLRTLVDAGIDALLVERDALGAGQTIASQGILHAGTKYALKGHAARASRAAGEAASVWRDCLRGDGPIDLTDLPLLSSQTYMFTTPGVGSRLAGLAASKALATGPKHVAGEHRPAPFARAAPGVQVYALDEPVVDLPALVRALASPVRERIVRAEVDASAGDAHALVLRPANGGVPIDVRTGVVVCAAGAGNERLLDGLGVAGVRMQRRPLHMVMARGDLPAMWAHCVGMSDKPRVTITSAAAGDRTVWYIGGQLAESGVGRDREEQIDEARRELDAVVPWVDLSGVEFATLRIDRAEGLEPDGTRPDTPVVRGAGSVIACWPTKLVLAPLAARGVLDLVRGAMGDRGQEVGAEEARVRSSLPRPVEALPVWDDGDLRWN